MPYIEGFVAAVPTANKDTYIGHAREGAEYFKKLGAFSWIEYPDKATRDAANQKMGEDSEMQDMEMPYDGKRMFWGGFEPVVND